MSPLDVAPWGVEDKVDKKAPTQSAEGWQKDLGWVKDPDDLYPKVALAMQFDMVKYEAGCLSIDLCPSRSLREPEYSPEVEAFIEEHGLQTFVKNALSALKSAFGANVQPRFDVSVEPEDGSLSMVVSIPVKNLEDGDYDYRDFCHGWWYDQIGTYGHYVGFQIVKDHLL